MICCLNPNCTQPMNPKTEEACQSCGAPLVKQLRGRYCPVKLLGRGGFGRSYLALDTDRLNTYCVVKQFAPQSRGTHSFNKAVQLFEQEAMRLNELGEHPQIPTLLAYFEQDLYLYLVQQMVEGRTLYQELQKSGPFDDAAIRQLLLAILPLLQFIHERGVIHRDITPTNIIRRRGDDLPVLIDFGVAKQFSEAILYEPGTRIGTEGYAPIEQLRGGQAYPASDLYSLGATCLHLMTGCRPESLYNPVEGKWLWREQLQQQGKPFDPKLADILDRMLKDLVGQRYQTAQDVLQDLKRLPTAQTQVPGWGSQRSDVRENSLFDTTQPPLSGPDQIRVAAVPPTVPPQRVSSPPISQGKGRYPTTSPQRSSGGISGPPATGWQCIRTLQGHSSWVTTVAFNPKTPTLISGSLDDTIKVWNLQTGTLLYTLEGHARGVNQVAVGSGGQVLASCGDDDLVRVWNLSEGTLLHTLRGHMRDVTSVAIGVQGFLLASGSEDTTLRLWKLDKGGLFKTFTGSTGMIKSVVMTPQEDLLISGGLDNKVRIWDIQTGQMVNVLSGHLNSVNEVAVSDKGTFIASASKDRTVRLWNLKDKALLHTLTDHSQEVNSVAISPDGRTLVSGSSDCTVRIWDVATGALQHTLSEHTNTVYSVAFHRTGRLIASASADKQIKVWKWMG